MNTHDIEPMKYGGAKSDDYVTGWNDCYAAVEADRQYSAKRLAAYRTLTNSLESRLNYLQAQHDELKKSTNPELLASELAANAILTEELEAYRKRRGEPVAWLDTEADDVITNQRKRSWETEYGAGGKSKATPYTVPLVLYEAPQPADPVKVPSDEQIREVFIAHGFTIKPGHGDLKPYVYAAARALLARYGNRQESK